jgi:ABC-type multidrug transport system fused ATPase/permease subunit
MVGKIRDGWRKTTLGRASRFLSRIDQRKILIVVTIQILLSILDLLGVALIGVLGALAVSGVESQKPGGRITQLMEILNISGHSLQFQATALGLSAATLLIGRSLLSVYFSRKTMKFLSRRGAQVTTNLISRLLRQDLLFIQAQSTQMYLYSVTAGVSTIVLGVLGTLINLVSDLALMLVMGLGLFVVDPTIAFGTLILFGAIVTLLYRFLHVRIKELGILDSSLSVSANEKIVEVLSSYRESVVRNSREFYSNRISKIKFRHADVLAELSFMPSISKYVIEASVVVGALFVGGLQFAKHDAVHAVATISIFMAAGTRIAPALLRVQQGALQIKGSLGSANPTLELFEKLNVEYEEQKHEKIDFIHKDFVPEVKIEQLTFSYPGQARPALNNISLEIKHGETVAIVGPSGSGKTTLVDVLLGILNPSHGFILIGGLSPLDAISKYPGGLAYVPQDVSVFDSSIRANIATGFEESLATDQAIWNCLEIANLDEVVRKLPDLIDTQVGERGARLSGGQRQRLGIARAMFTNPKLLVLDEATSALDGLTEAAISEEVSKLKGNTTVVLIAHRLSTARNADKVVYIDGGEVRHIGTFDEVRSAIPDFEEQAKLMGL